MGRANALRPLQGTAIGLLFGTAGVPRLPRHIILIQGIPLL
jgi:hypothetical protein